ncbi:TetR/AcrR family transcriptional regulator [Chengkuizengella axinellae]|uniref:TetR/AcrR family transcriptional regulator n=1 Tax=Chengkuizengella axinellae TaxID=3064388 RepID=A0ABT9J3Q9_9BACL|nr:TetR/AcrR family transcriptional regulator [Chengkuizengella sp. 2205SS18-9]MDP5276267.1 TetR/AcrR family transcriptional regulator [Chengkuizengella sp. 2205SS18-9]
MKTKDKILSYTKQLILENGVDAVSGRKLCDDLGINISSISYHFGSKDNLIQIALIELTDEEISFSNILYEDILSLDERLYSFFKKLFVTLTRRPELAHQLIVGKSKYTRDNALSNELLLYIHSQLESINIFLSPEEIRLRIYQIISSIAFSAESGVFNHAAEETQAHYIETLVDQLLLKE